MPSRYPRIAISPGRRGLSDRYARPRPRQSRDSTLPVATSIRRTFTQRRVGDPPAGDQQVVGPGPAVVQEARALHDRHPPCASRVRSRRHPDLLLKPAAAEVADVAAAAADPEVLLRSVSEECAPRNGARMRDHHRRIPAPCGLAGCLRRQALQQPDELHGVWGQVADEILTVAIQWNDAEPHTIGRAQGSAEAPRSPACQ